MNETMASTYHDGLRACRDTHRAIKASAFSNGVKVARIECREGYAEIRWQGIRIATLAALAGALVAWVWQAGRRG